ncbi:hypothetical protein C0995_014054, partial [Termitomyces sp. Mi166
MQKEFKIIQKMQSHGLIRRGLQATSDAGALIGACKKITEALDDLKNTSLILKDVKLMKLETSKTAAYAAHIDSEYVSRRSCTEGTRQEVLEGIYKWLDDSNSPAIYWLTGAAGMGKTTIAMTICEKIARQSNSSNEAANAAKRQGLPCPIIVVDALDENPGGFAFLKGLLEAVKAKELEGLKFFITSRTDPDISALCATFPPNAVCYLQNISKDSTQNDIRLYLKECFPSTESALLEKLTKASNGIFIYAATVVHLVIGPNGSTVNEQAMVLKEILSQTSDSDVSMGLNQLYNQIVWDA